VLPKTCYFWMDTNYGRPQSPPMFPHPYERPGFATPANRAAKRPTIHATDRGKYN